MSQGRRWAVQPPLFLPTADLYRHIPQDPFYTRLATVIDWTFIYPLTAPLYAPTLGRPSLDPVVFIKSLLFGFFEQIAEYRRLELRLAESLTARRFLGYALDAKTPDESTLRKTLALYPEEVFAAIFEHVLAQCHAAGLLAGRHLGVDSSTVEAQAGLDSLRHRVLGCTYRQYVQALRTAGEPVPPTLSNTDWVSASDPDARVAVLKDGHTDLAYKVSLATDLETGVVVGMDVTTADVCDQQDLLPALEHAETQLTALGQPGPATVTTDKGFHDGAILAELAERQVTTIVRPPAPGRVSAPGFAPTAFPHDAATDTLTCPAGQPLTRRAGEERQLPADRRVYRARAGVCRACPHWGTCTRDRNGRKVIHSDFAVVVAANAARARAPEGRALLAARQTRGEAPFSYAKQGGRGRIRGRGLAVATKQLLLCYAAWNCLLLIKQQVRQADNAVDMARKAGGVVLQAVLGALQRLGGAIRGWYHRRKCEQPSRPSPGRAMAR